MLSPKVPLLHFFANQLCAYECNGDTYTFGRAWGMDRISFSQHLCASVTHRRPIPSALRNINKIEYEYFFALSISHYHVSKHCIITAISKVDRIQMKTKKCSLDDLHCKCNSIRIFLTFFFFLWKSNLFINQSIIHPKYNAYTYFALSKMNFNLLVAVYVDAGPTNILCKQKIFAFVDICMPNLRNGPNAMDDRSIIKVTHAHQPHMCTSLADNTT